MDGRFNTMAVLLLLAAAALCPTTMATTYIVGDSLGWTVPPNPSSSYSSWASNKVFVVGDILVFNFASGRHDVAEVTKAAYDSCSGGNPISDESSSPARITLTTAGDHHFICTFPGHCSGGQKLSITVRGRGPSSPAPQPSTLPPTTSPVSPPSLTPTPTPSSTVTSPSLAPEPSSPRSPSPSLAPEPSSSPSLSPAPSRTPVTYIVGDSSGWTVPPTGATFYDGWTRDKTFAIGDVLVFNFANQRHDVAEVTKQNYESCSGDSAISVVSNPPVRITLSKSGEHFYICTFPGHCGGGQKLAINVTGSGSGGATTSPPSIATSPSADTIPSNQSPTSAPPPPNSATSLSGYGVSATFFAIVIALLY